MGLFKFLKEKFSKKPKENTDKYVKGMEKSRANFASKLDSLSKKYKSVNQEYFENLEEILIEADVGVNLSIRIIEEVIEESKENNIVDPKSINELVVDKMFLGYATKGGNIHNEIEFVKDGPTVLLVAGVNGVGKTTTIAKLAYRYIKQGKKVMLCAADTFRAGAVEQLTVWANRLNCPIVYGKPNSDPASVAFDGVRKAKEQNIDLLIVDTAGRLQNKQNLMLELSKISRVLSKEIPGAPHEAFLVIDATTGQNGLSQAKEFLDCIKLTGIVITKMDGTSKGGIILAIRDTLGISVRFIGLGEKMEDLEEFDLDKYLYGLCLGEKDE
ncbi:MAG TPA: signal recognition particle-docking protein FtsY [Firmicutes bacterium]|nr:signal recognition particle-docking protein FtsY [Bacillota bacterium]